MQRASPVLSDARAPPWEGKNHPPPAFEATARRRAELSRTVPNLRRDAEIFSAPHADGSPVWPSQQPSLNRQRGHCHVWWRQSIAAPQRRHFST